MLIVNITPLAPLTLRGGVARDDTNYPRTSRFTKRTYLIYKTWCTVSPCEHCCQWKHTET